jgi:lipoprotein signal peptidase
VFGLSANAFLLVAAAGTVVVDQATKAMVSMRQLGERDRRARALGHLPRARYAAAGWLCALLYLELAFAVDAVPPGLAVVGLGLALGGAGANLIDRVARGTVVDFISVGSFPVFNLADAAMVLGAVTVIAGFA